jgi:hypothetical protein
MPLISSVVLLVYVPTIIQTLGLKDGGSVVAVVLSSAIPTYLIGSLFYPTNLPDPSPIESIRFTRKNDLYRAGVIATYGRLYGTPFNVMFYIRDVVCSFVADNVIGERPVGTKQRRSEFLVALLWVIGSQVVQVFVPIGTSGVGLFLGMMDRTLWRTTYIALVDDVIGVLTRPNLRRLRGKATLVLVQAFVIFMIESVLLTWGKALAKSLEEDMMKLWKLEGTSSARQALHV